MTTPTQTLTREQAFQARVFVQDPKEIRAFASATCMFFNGVTHDYDAVEAALAAYDAANVTISREDLRRLGDVLNAEMTLRQHYSTFPIFGPARDHAQVRWNEDTAILRRIEAALESK